MNLRSTESESRFRAEARAWLEANNPAPALTNVTNREEEYEKLLEWERTLFRGGWSVLTWPTEYGGRAATLWEWLIFEEEYFRIGAPQRITQNGISLLAPTLFEFGTDEQKQRVLPKMAAAEELWAQGWSEPGAGSDLASLTSRAVRDPERGGWRVSGQKTWTTRGSWCTHLFGLFRSDPDAGKHRGLTYLMLDLRSEGVTVRPFGRLDGKEDFADVFLDNVFVPDENIIGEPDNGWRVAMATTGSERGVALRSPARYMEALRRLSDLIDSSRPNLADPFRRELVELWTDAEAYRAFTYQQVSRVAAGINIGSESSLNKIFWSEMDVRIHRLAMRVLGQAGWSESAWTTGYQFSLGGTIYAGANEIQRNIIAERVLGLPRG